MKKLILMVSLVFFTMASLEAQKPPQKPHGVRVSQNLLVAYGVNEGRVVFMEVDDASGRVFLKIQAKDSDSPETVEKLKEYLKKEVMRLAQPGKSTQLGNTAYIFTYDSGFPVWGPSQQKGEYGSFESMFFAYRTNVLGSQIRAHGTKKIVGYYGYDK